MKSNVIKNREYETIEPKEGSVYMFCKRAMDIIGSLAGLILLSPLLLIIAIAIKIEDPKGSIFFSQQRCGKDNKLFQIYKFRLSFHYIPPY